MKVLLAALMVVATTAWADTTGNLVNNNNWSGIGARAPDPNDCCSNPAGSLPLYDTATNIIKWSYSLATVEQGWAINQALQGTGIQVGGYNYSYQIRNLNGSGGQNGTDSITVNTWLKNSAGQVILSTSNIYNTQFDWTTFSGTRTLGAPMAVADLGTGGISFRGNDGGYWAGLYGPEVRNVSYTLNYTVDQCAADPLSSPNCPGYQQALFTQQCSANPLSDPACPGYATAYHDQQCSANPLYANTCPGYAQAYYTQQCTANPLYDSTCPGYAQAYYDQQCSANPLYDNQCPGYAQAYFDQQCSANPLYDNQCPGYAQAYFDQQCGISALYDQACPGYAQAYFDQQCGLDGLYDRQCPNYNEAYAKKNILNIGNTTTAAVTTPTEPLAAETESAAPTVVVASAAVESDPVSTATASSAASPSTSVTSPTSVSPAAVTSVVNPAPEPPAPAPSTKAAAAESTRAETKAAEKKQEQKKTERAIARILPRTTNSGSSEKAATEKAQSAATEAVEQAATATTIEAQQAAQNLVLGLMGYNPAFSAYQNSIVPDINAATMARQYNRPTVDNRRALRALSGASDRLHQEMVDQQYGRMP
jgi:hypothetical protein